MKDKKTCINICRTDSKGICLDANEEKSHVLEKISQRRNDTEDYYGGFAF